MSSKRRLRRNECKGKARYEGQMAAQAAIGRLRRRTGTREWLNAYRCRWCNGWHFGHPPRRVRQAIMGEARRT